MQSDGAMQERLQTTLYSIGDAVITTDAGGVVREMNPVAEVLTGWREADAAGRSFSDAFVVLREDTHERVADPVMETLRSGAIVGLTNHTLLVSRDGVERPIAASSAPVRSTGGVLLGCVIVFRDQTAERARQLTLEESERRHRELFEGNPHAMWVYDDETLAFLAVNHAAIARYGYSRDEFLGMTLADIRPAEDVEAMKADAAAVPAGYEGGRRWRHRIKDGSLLWVEVASHPLRWGARQGRLVLALDVTAQVRVETRLKWQAGLMARLASGEPLPSLLAALSAFTCELCPGVMCGVMLVDPKTGALRPEAGHGVPSELQRAADPTPVREGAGVCGTAAARRAPFVVTDVEVSSAFNDYRAVASRHGIAAAWSYPFFDARLHLLGTLYMYASDQGAPTAVEDEVARFAATLAGIVVERALDRAALHEREARLRAIFDHEPECVKVLDRRGRLLDMNPAGLRLIEADGMAQVRNAAVGDLVVPEHRRQFAALTERVADGGEGHLEFEIVGLKGTRRWLETHAVPLRDAEGRVTAVLGLTRDVTQQKALAAELLQAQKLESVALLAGGVAHDFNNMLGVIQGQLELALAELPKDSAVRDGLAQALEASRRSAELTRQLLAFARREPSSPRPIDVNGRLASLVGMLGRLIGERIHLLWRPGDGLWPVRIDPGQFDQLLTNLVVNARDAMLGSGTLTVATRNVERDTAEGRADVVELSVTDTGSGMDDATRTRIFEPFFTTKPQGQGTGLGLATVYGVARQHGGAVEVDSRPGHGSTFRVLLPRCHDAVPPQAAEAAVQPAAAAGGETVLVVEDEPALLALVTNVLCRQGHVVLAAANAQAAEAVAREHTGPLHLLLTDMIMPGLDGHQLWARMREAYPGLRCLVMSGYARASQPMGSGEIPTITKPFSMQALAEAVRAALDAPPRPEARKEPRP